MIDLYILGLAFICLLVCIWQQIEIADLREHSVELHKRSVAATRQINEINRFIREVSDE